MSGHGYESGRLNLPFVGISTFGNDPMSKNGQPLMQMSPFWARLLMREHSGVRVRGLVHALYARPRHSLALAMQAPMITRMMRSICLDLCA